MNRKRADEELSHMMYEELHPKFPEPGIADGVATFALKARNGYVHTLRVPLTVLPLMRKVWKKGWRFEVSTYGKTKKVGGPTPWGWVPLHNVWFVYRCKSVASLFDMRGRVPRCRNGNWLDWTQDNVYLPRRNWRSEKRRLAYMEAQNSMSEEAMELIHARVAGPAMAAKMASYWTTDKGVIEAFRVAAEMPGIRVRPRGASSRVDGE